MDTLDLLVHWFCLAKFYTVLAHDSTPGSISSATTISQLYTIRTFTWNTLSAGCPNVHYNILASNCGSCPTTTNHTNATCTEVPTDGSTCVFVLQTVVCGIITGELSNQVSLFNRESDIPGQLWCCTERVHTYMEFNMWGTMYIIILLSSYR